MPSSDVVVRARGLRKRYGIAPEGESHSTLAETVLSRIRHPFRRPRVEEFWALNGVDFDIHRGDVVGIVGRNGAGKSTLLKILSRITEPTEGMVELHGRVGSLLEVGTGFHPELTGRENVYLNGAILGMRRKEIDRHFDAIVAFAEIDRFLDTPVKRYSSGMYVRLAFAVAAHLEPEILIVDEVLAVGDASFQKKCIGKMSDVAKGGRTVIFVSHNMAAVQGLCTSGICLSQGRVVKAGPADAIVDHYLSVMVPQILDASTLERRTDRSGNGRLRVTSFHLENAEGEPIASCVSGSSVRFVFGYRVDGAEPVGNVDIGLSLHTQQNETLFVYYTSYGGRTLTLEPGRGFVRCRVDDLPIAPGRYVVGFRATASNDEADWPRDGVGYLDVEPGDFYGTGHRGCEGAVRMMVRGSWDVQGTPTPAAR